MARNPNININTRYTRTSKFPLRLAVLIILPFSGSFVLILFSKSDSLKKKCLKFRTSVVLNSLQTFYSVKSVKTR